MPVHAMKSLCEQDGLLYAHWHIIFFIPRTSKRAASEPVPRSSHSQLQKHRAIYTAHTQLALMNSFIKGRYSAFGIGRATAPVSRAHEDSGLGGHTYTLTHTYTETYRHT